MPPSNPTATPTSPSENNPLRVKREEQSLRMLTVDALRRALLRRYFQPGDRLVERELCELTGVSRTSVREALRHLETEGLIENIPHRGPSVATLTKQDAIELFEVRSALEPMAARLFMARAGVDELKALENKLTHYHQAAQTNNTDAMMTSISDVYDQLFDNCGNTTAAKIIRTLHVRVAFSRAITYQKQTATDLRKLVANSKSMLRAIKRRDSEALANTCLDRVRLSKDIAIKVLDDD